MGYQLRIELGLEKLGYKKEDYINIRKEAEANKSYVSMCPYWHRLGGTVDLASGHAFDGSYETFCLCDACEALDPKQGVKVQLYDRSGETPRWIEHVSMTDRYVFFWNEITKRVVEVHPDAYISVYAYSAYTAPPLDSSDR